MYISKQRGCGEEGGVVRVRMCTGSTGSIYITVTRGRKDLWITMANLIWLFFTFTLCTIAAAGEYNWYTNKRTCFLLFCFILPCALGAFSLCFLAIYGWISQVALIYVLVYVLINGHNTEKHYCLSA